MTENWLLFSGAGMCLIGWLARVYANYRTTKQRLATSKAGGTKL